MSKQHASKLDDARRICQTNSNANSTNKKQKSEICINTVNKKGSYTIVRSATGTNIADAKHKQKEYYKRYEHDEVPVKDSTDEFKGKTSASKVTDAKSITNSELDRLEQKLLKNISQDLQFECASANSLESNLKFFKATIQEIFNTFQLNLRDYDVYKQKLNEILTRSQEESITDMENFIKEMIQNIISCDSSAQSLITNDNMVQVDNQVEVHVQDGETSTMQDQSSKTDTFDSLKTFDTSCDESVQLVVEAYKNDNYLTDSTFPNDSKSRNHTFDNRVNVYLLSNTPCVIKMNNRSLLSEIDIKNTNSEGASSYVASTENIKKLAAKKIEIEQYEMHDPKMSDREIPVKNSCAKKNLCGSDERAEQEKDVEEGSKSFISKICNFLCKKLRRNSLT